MMAGIKGKNTKPELVVRRFLHAAGFRFRLHDKKLPGRPDIILPKYHLAIFVHGCFWHRHQGCRLATEPANNYEKWKNKLEGNIQRDLNQVQLLEQKGWRVLVIWECSLKSVNPDFSWLPEHVKSQLQYKEWPSPNSTQTLPPQSNLP
jgi:DNA mismatch endonuclease (patch repair protein)